MIASFRNRIEAGRLLAMKLSPYAHRPDVLVLALPRGGVPVGYEVARALQAPLDVFVVRKLGVPGHEESASGMKISPKPPMRKFGPFSPKRADAESNAEPQRRRVAEKGTAE